MVYKVTYGIYIWYIDAIHGTPYIAAPWIRHGIGNWDDLNHWNIGSSHRAQGLIELMKLMCDG